MNRNALLLWALREVGVDECRINENRERIGLITKAMNGEFPGLFGKDKCPPLIDGVRFFLQRVR
jgi:hypothetical protein